MILDIQSSLLTDKGLFLIFSAVIVLFLVVDLGLFQKKAHTISFKNALWQTIFWVTVSLSFGILIYFNRGKDPAEQYITAYLMEWSLSVDNIFVFLLILTYFGTDEKYYHKVLYFGILGAIVFRGLFITIGIALINQFHWILYIFGVILIVTGIKMVFSDRQQKFTPEKNLVYRLLKRYFHFSDEIKGGKFFGRIDGKFGLSTLLLVVLLIETTDIIFALDSIPAVFAISQDPFIIYTSNIFAVMGLRAMFFLLSGIINKFRFLKQGISFILVFIGVKMLLEIFEYKLPTIFALYIILAMLLSSILMSVLVPERKGRE